MRQSGKDVLYSLMLPSQVWQDTDGRAGTRIRKEEPCLVVNSARFGDSALVVISKHLEARGRNVGQGEAAENRQLFDRGKSASNCRVQSLGSEKTITPMALYSLEVHDVTQTMTCVP